MRLRLTSTDLYYGVDANLSNKDVIDLDAAYGAAPTTDIAPSDVDLKPDHAYSQATGGSQTGGSTYISSGVGSRQVTIDDYNNCGTDTVTVTRNDSAADVLTEGSEWTAATDNATTATSLASAGVAQGGAVATGGRAGGVFAPSSSVSVNVQALPGQDPEQLGGAISRAVGEELGIVLRQAGRVSTQALP